MMNNLVMEKPQLAQQSANAVVMVRPHYFYPNEQTARDNHFQQSPNLLPKEVIAANAFAEVTNAVNTLRDHKIAVYLFDDDGHSTPDSVFPNNWFSTLSNGNLCVFPMYCENRRQEFRQDIINCLQQHFSVSQFIDYRQFVETQQYLEGTGAMVIDHQANIAYATRSKRLTTSLFTRYCESNQLTPVLFDATDNQGEAIYHSNVMMSVTPEFVIIALSCIRDEAQRQTVINQIEASGKQVIDITEQQMAQFCGNVLSLQNVDNQEFLALSLTAFNAFSEKQKQVMMQSVTLLPIDVSTIELAGGSIRCMMADIHLPSH